jgi:hypothetical protein
MYAIQGKPKRMITGWELCFDYNENDNRLPCIFFYLHVAEEEIVQWIESDETHDYRIVPVEVKFW